MRAIFEDDLSFALTIGLFLFLLWVGNGAVKAKKAYLQYCKEKEEDERIVLDEYEEKIAN